MAICIDGHLLSAFYVVSHAFVTVLHYLYIIAYIAFCFNLVHI